MNNQNGLTFISTEIQKNEQRKKNHYPLYLIPRQLAGCDMTWEFREKLYKFLNNMPFNKEISNEVQ